MSQENARVRLLGLGVERAFMGERELALAMAHHALMRMGRTDDEADATLEALRRPPSPNPPSATPPVRPPPPA